MNIFAKNLLYDYPMCRHSLFNLRASCELLSVILKDKITFDCDMDSIECLAWNGNKDITEKIYRSTVGPEPNTEKEKIERAKRFEEKMLANTSMSWGDPIEYNIYRGLDPYYASKTNPHKKNDKSINLIPYIRIMTAFCGVCNVPAQKDLEYWLESQKCYKYSKFLIKFSVCKRYSEWRANIEPQMTLLWGDMWKIRLNLLPWSSDFITMNADVIYNKKTVQTYFGQVELGVAYCTCLKITGENATFLPAISSYQNRKAIEKQTMI